MKGKGCKCHKLNPELFPHTSTVFICHSQGQPGNKHPEKGLTGPIINTGGRKAVGFLLIVVVLFCIYIPQISAMFYAVRDLAKDSCIIIVVL